jgi:hypothetical protein
VEHNSTCTEMVTGRSIPITTRFYSLYNEAIGQGLF